MALYKQSKWAEKYFVPAKFDLCPGLFHGFFTSSNFKDFQRFSFTNRGVKKLTPYPFVKLHWTLLIVCARHDDVLTTCLPLKGNCIVVVAVVVVVVDFHVCNDKWEKKVLQGRSSCKRRLVRLVVIRQLL